MGKLNTILSPDDLKKGELIEPGWHPAEYVQYEETEASADAKNPGSVNVNMYFKILDGPGKGATVKRLFNETAMGFGKNLWATLALPYDKATGYRLTSDLLESKVGSKLMIYIKRGRSNKGNDFNDVADFKPLA